MNLPAALMLHFGHMYCGVYAQVRTGGTLRTGPVSLEVSPSDDPIRRAAVQGTSPSIASWPRLATVSNIVEEGEDVRSVWFIDPLTRFGSLASYSAAQYVRLHALDGRACWRAYTISGIADYELRVTVKRDAGIGSRAIHDLRVGDRVTITGPDGAFGIPPGTGPLLLLTAGIGITPAVAMSRVLVAANSDQDVTAFHVARTTDAPLSPELRSSIERLPRGRAILRTSRDADWSGRVDLDAVARDLAPGTAVVLCGPGGFIEAARSALMRAGFPDTAITSESFASPDLDVDLRAPSSSGPFPVHFARSGLTADWTPADGTLLDLAEAQGLAVASHCRAGLCGTCRVHLRAGAVEKLIGPQDGIVLACCCVPTGPIELDL